MDVRRVAGRPLVGEETEVVVPVHALRGAARVDHVDLGGDLVAGAEPGLADQGQHVVGVVVGEDLGGVQGRLVQGAPHPVVGAGLREVVTAGGARRPLPLDQRAEDGGGPVHHVRVRERAPQYDDAGAVQQRADPFGPHRGRVGRRPDAVAVVDGDVPLDPHGARVVGRIGALGDQHTEGVEVAVPLPAQPHHPWSRVLGSHAGSFRRAAVSVSLMNASPSFNEQKPIKNPSPTLGTQPWHTPTRSGRSPVRPG